MVDLARNYNARQQMLAHNTLQSLNTAAVDSKVEVRRAVVKVIGALAKEREFGAPLVAAGFVKLLVNRIKSSPDGGPPDPIVQALGVGALGRVCQTDEGVDEAIKVDAVPTCCSLLRNDDREVTIQAAYCLAVLTYRQDEKSVALKHGGECLPNPRCLHAFLTSRLLAYAQHPSPRRSHSNTLSQPPPHTPSLTPLHPPLHTPLTHPFTPPFTPRFSHSDASVRGYAWGRGPRDAEGSRGKCLCRLCWLPLLVASAGRLCWPPLLATSASCFC